MWGTAATENEYQAAETDLQRRADPHRDPVPSHSARCEGFGSSIEPQPDFPLRPRLLGLGSVTGLIPVPERAGLRVLHADPANARVFRTGAMPTNRYETLSYDVPVPFRRDGSRVYPISEIEIAASMQTSV